MIGHLDVLSSVIDCIVIRFGLANQLSALSCLAHQLHPEVVFGSDFSLVSDLLKLPVLICLDPKADYLKDILFNRQNSSSNFAIKM